MTYNFYFVISGAVLFLIGRLLYGKKDIAGILSAIIFVFFGGLASCGFYVNYFDFIDVPVCALIIFILIDIADVFGKLIIHTDKSR